MPYSQITSVAFVSDKSILGKFFSVSQISILTAAKTFEVEFRGTEKARHVHDVILWKILR